MSPRRRHVPPGRPRSVPPALGTVRHPSSVLSRLPRASARVLEASRLQLGYSETMSLPCAVNAQITVTPTAITTIDQIG
jgi:hypothetical protein